MELGSEYNLPLSELTIKENNIFKYLSSFQNKYFFDSGRSALRHFALSISGEDEILMPEYICESVTNCFSNSQICFYKVNTDFSVDIDSLDSQINERTRVIFLMHYFGRLQPNEQLKAIKSIAKNNKLIIIEDTTHSIFSKSDTVGDYQICSIRKWMPVPSGGILYSRDDPLGILKNVPYFVSTDNTRSYGMILKDLFLTRHFDCNSEYREIFNECEDRLDRQKELFLLSDFSRYIASCEDIELLKKTRIRNYWHLKNELSRLGIEPAVQLHESDCPLTLPVLIKDRDKFRAFLIEHKIYCAVHWPFDGVKKDSRLFAQECARMLISLPIDQRYDSDAIDYLVDTIHQYMENNEC